MFDTIKSAKAAVSSLRRELKTLSKPASQLSHSDCMELLARVMGHKNWNTLVAALRTKDDACQTPAPVGQVEMPASRLSNDGSYDFVPRGAQGTPRGPLFQVLQGTYEKCPGVSDVASAWRLGTGSRMRMQHAGGTELFWDDQRTVREGDQCVWVDENWNFLLDGELVLLPEDYDGDPYDDESLPVREALVQAYAKYLLEQGIILAKDHQAAVSQLDAARQVLGLALTRREEQELVRRTTEPL